jgi:type II secretory pathway pseudopilin PulG
MIVIVIVGVLSSVALPNFLNQTQKAKATECTTRMASLLKQVQNDYQVDQDINQAMLAIVGGTTAAGGALTVVPTTAKAGITPDAISRDSNGGQFLYTVSTPTAGDTQLQIKCQAWTTTASLNSTENKTGYPGLTVDNSLEAKGMFGCIDLVNGQIKLSRRLETVGTAYNLSCRGTQDKPIPAI